MAVLRSFRAGGHVGLRCREVAGPWAVGCEDCKAGQEVSEWSCRNEIYEECRHAKRCEGCTSQWLQ
ncbi:hypothetical protein E2C01_001325 [Portunus trituberculatus]|uniref:Uncharacterized protein n=1 Tax=Portunus trituberculatus TaxID=210409 RepID=A0A5B7CJ01_PORTR|nr:hypothetical protein [Portunus trituberculatus]